MMTFVRTAAVLIGISCVVAACHQPVRPTDPSATDGIGDTGESWAGETGPTKKLETNEVTPHTIVLNSGHEQHPECAMSGGVLWLYYASNSMDPSNYNIYRTKASGGASSEEVTSLARDEYWPTVSPDGRFLAFGANFEGSWNIYVMQLGDSKSQPKRITQNNGSQNIQPSWSPDGKSIVYATSTHSGEYVLRRVTLGGSMSDGDGLSDSFEVSANAPLQSTEFAELAPRARRDNSVPMGDDGYPSATLYEELRTAQGEPLYGQHPQVNPGNPDLIVYQSFSRRGKRWSGLRTFNLKTSVVTVLELADDRGAIQPRWSPANVDAKGKLSASNYIIYSTVGANPDRKDKKAPVGGDGFAILSLDGQEVRTIPNPIGKGRVGDPLWVEHLGDQKLYFAFEDGIAWMLLN